MNRVTRDRHLTPAEAAKYRAARDRVAAELPDLAECRHDRLDAARTRPVAVPSVSVALPHTGASAKSNALGMRPMQERVYQSRGEQYLLIKSPPASGKSRALMFVALDKLRNQGLKQAVVVVPERAIGASFRDEPLSKYGFPADWRVEPRWNLCDAPGADDGGGKVDAVEQFLESADDALVCTHATFRFAVDRFGVEAFDDRLIAVDEFHHISARPDNKLGEHVRAFIERDRVHIVAMTGSYFRGDAAAVLASEDERRFRTVTYTYYEQLAGYAHLKRLDLGYYFYSGRYADEIAAVLDPAEKTIVHIPSVNSRESTKDKTREANEVMDALGEWTGADPATGFQLIKTETGRTIKVADLVDDDPSKREVVAAALRSPAMADRDFVDVIVALGMAKEGFDWVWCEHALTVGYRNSLTEIVQIIGRATRDAPGKPAAKFTNLIAEPDATEQTVAEAVNDTLKAIAASLLMEQVLAPRFEFRPKNPNAAGPTDGFDYGGNGYVDGRCNVGMNESTGACEVEIKGLAEPKGKEAQRICREDITDLVTSFVQDKVAVERGMFDGDLIPEELTVQKMGKIVREKYPELDDADREAVRQRAVAAVNLVQRGKQELLGLGGTAGGDEAEPRANTALIDGVRRFVEVRDLDVDLIDSINPFGGAYAIMAKAMSESSLRQIAAAIGAKTVRMDPEEARALAKRALTFKKEHGRLPSITSPNAWEKRMAEGVAHLARMQKDAAHA